MTPRSLRLRLTLLVAVAGLISIAALTFGFNLLLRANVQGDADRVLQARASAALELVEASGGKVRLLEVPDEAAPEAGVWIYSGDRAIQRPQAPPPVQALAESLNRSRGAYAESAQEDLKLHAVPVSGSGRRVGTVIVALSLEPYERSTNRALVGSAIFAAVMLALIIGSTLLVVNRALDPVARMSAEAADWSEHDLDHRFNLGPPHDELTQLASTFDSMLARLAASLRHEQRMTAEISHELRTPLAAIAAESELALRRPRADEAYREALRRIQRKASQLEEILEMLLLAARADALPTSETADANTAAEQALDSFREMASSRKVELELTPAITALNVDASLGTASQILSPLIENALRYGRDRVGVTVTAGGEQVVFAVSDDGPGIAADERERIFEPGARGSAAANGDAPEGAGLGLALARRLARAVGGDVVAPVRDDGGLVEIRLPQAPPTARH